MRRSCNLVLAMLLFAVSLPSFAQATGDAQQTPPDAQQASPTDEGQPQENPPAAAGTKPRHPAPCWRVAGISPAAVNQRWHLEDDAKIKISGVCSDPTLGPDQKLGKIHEINQQRDDAITKLIPEKQLSAFKSCQAEREKENASRPKRTPERELGPCGGVIPGHAHDHDMAKPSK